MQQSLELRWFFKADAGKKEAFDWYNNIGADANNPANSRTDFYLNNFCNGTLGIKLREQQLEIKERVTVLSKLKTHLNGKGKIEVYNKCEFNIAAKDTFSSLIINKKAHEKWIPLQKKRKLAKIELTDSIKILPGSVVIKDGCSIEITELTLQNKHWWTLCFEAYAKKNDINDNLHEALGYISDSLIPLRHLLKLKLSMGYPAWLDKVVKKM